jgi:hypothetical protein
MSPEGTLAVAFVAFPGSLGCVAVIAFNFDRIVVRLLRCSGMPVYPLAVSIAVLIYKHPEQWTCRTHEMLHPKVGSVWTSNKAYGLHVDSDFGRWDPNWIERRIIRDAVDWRIRTFVRNRITQAMRLPAP